MRVVIDASVFISADTGSGPSHQLIQHWLTNRSFEVVVCPKLIKEVSKGLEKPRRRQHPDEHKEKLIAALEVAATHFPDPENVSPETRDQDDDYLVAIAKQSNASLILSLDKDLLEWEEQDPPVQKPEVLLGKIRSGQS